MAKKWWIMKITPNQPWRTHGILSHCVYESDRPVIGFDIGCPGEFYDYKDYSKKQIEKLVDKGVLSHDDPTFFRYFVDEMREGHYVIIAQGMNKIHCIVEISGRYSFGKPRGDEWFRYKRRVRLVKRFNPILNLSDIGLENNHIQPKTLIKCTYNNKAGSISGHFDKLFGYEAEKIIRQQSKKGRVKEGSEHHRLKKYIKKNPSILNIDKKQIIFSKDEFPFKSGDKADILFALRENRYVVVEVETTDPEPGAYQAIKYKSLTCAYFGLKLPSIRVRSILVAWSIPEELKVFCGRYGIEVKELKI